MKNKTYFCLMPVPVSASNRKEAQAKGYKIMQDVWHSPFETVKGLLPRRNVLRNNGTATFTIKSDN